MILLEDEAKKVRCQETALVDYCIGSCCMAWRWATEQQEEEAGFTEAETSGKLTGYCGKAGRP